MESVKMLPGQVIRQAVSPRAVAVDTGHCRVNHTLTWPLMAAADRTTITRGEVRLL